jgi:2',3'-cyclic-nucleotide 2'-phosphodiesterase/3'-nucleotidase
MEKKPLKGTLVRANSYISKQRAAYGDNLLLIDNGDILQGQPCVYWSNYVMPENENLAASVINYMRYDAETVGNHDIEPGHKVYDKWIREVRCPLLGANIVKEEYKNGEARPSSIYDGIQPYSVHYKDGVKICVIGMLTPAIPNWLNKSIWKGIEFEEMVSCAKKWVKYIQENEKPDLLFGLFHSGLDSGIKTDEYEENATAAVAREVPGFDIIFFGHDHQVHNFRVKNSEGRDVVCLDPSCYAVNVAEAQVELTYRDGRLVKKDIQGKIVNVSDEEIDTRMVERFQPQIDKIKDYVGQKLGTFACGASSRDCFFGPSAFNDFIHDLQLRISGADISMSAPLAFDARIEAGDITVADLFKLYRYENMIYTLEMTGEEIRRHLEMSYDLWVNTMTSPDDHIMRIEKGAFGSHVSQSDSYGFVNMTFNFDSAAGIDYEVDVTKPDGEKVRILRMSDGTPFDVKKTYRVAMNSYRGNGGGELLTKGAGIPLDELSRRIVFQSERDQRHYIMLEIEKMGHVMPKANNNWRFVPSEWTEPALKRDRKLIFND